MPGWRSVRDEAAMAGRLLAGLGRLRAPLRRRVAASSAVVLAMSSGSCTAPTRETVVAPTIRVAYLGQADFGDLPSLLAHERLRAQGYRVEETRYATTDVIVEAVSRGSAEFGVMSFSGTWAAAGRGARVRSVMEHAANPHRLVVAPRIGTCADLDGRRLALQSEAAAGTALTRVFITEECPDVRPHTLFLPESANRAAALLADGVDAAAIELGVLHWLEAQAPGRFRVLVDFAERWPSIKTTGVHVNMDFAEAHPDLVVTYLRARLATNRDLTTNPELLVAEAVRVFGPSDRWPQVARAYIDAGAWAADGGLSENDILRTLAFLASQSKRRLSADEVADLRFLREALASN